MVRWWFLCHAEALAWCSLTSLFSVLLPAPLASYSWNDCQYQWHEDFLLELLQLLVKSLIHFESIFVYSVRSESKIWQARDLPQSWGEHSMELSGVFMQKRRRGWDYQESLMVMSSRNDGWTQCLRPWYRFCERNWRSLHLQEQCWPIKLCAGGKVLFGATCHMHLLSAWNAAITMKKLNFKTLFNLN